MELRHEKIKVGITGQKGFMGSHLFNLLAIKADITCITFERNFFAKPDKLEEFVSKCDVIVHLAAMNRHPDQNVIYKTNVRLVNQLTESCMAAKVNPKIIFSSSIQEEKDNLYGQSKREGRKLLENWAKNNNGKVSTLIIPNVYGPFGKPFYNSVVATFCHQLTHSEKPRIDVDGKLNLIYINELSELFYNEIVSDSPQINVIEVPATATLKVSEIYEILDRFKSSYFENGAIPALDSSVELNLFNTYRSYVPNDYFPKKFVQHTDERGSFVEMMRAGVKGQTSYSTTKPGITRGNHYHTRKIERFAVIKGKALIQLRRVNTDEVVNYELDGENPAYVDMPVWTTHNIKNIGEGELITLFWINEPYDPEDPDTYFETV